MLIGHSTSQDVQLSSRGDHVLQSHDQIGGCTVLLFGRSTSCHLLVDVDRPVSLSSAAQAPRALSPGFDIAKRQMARTAAQAQGSLHSSPVHRPALQLGMTNGRGQLSARSGLPVTPPLSPSHMVSCGSFTVKQTAGLRVDFGSIRSCYGANVTQ